jgi:hypothetical protein
MPRTATPREFELLAQVGRCEADVVSCIPPAGEVGEVWAISVRDDRDVIQGEDSPPTQEFACSCTANPQGLGDVLDVGLSDALDEPAHSESRPVHRGNAFLVVLDPNELVLRIEGKAVTLTRTQFSILSYLIQNEGRWVTTGELIREVLGTHHQPDTSLVRVHVHAIRRRLGVRSPWLESDRRRARGYRWRQFPLECDTAEPKRESS